MPADDEIRAIAAVALEDVDAAVVGVRIVGEREGGELNARWRGRDYASNVLSFPATLSPGVGINLLGDIALCAPLVEREAHAQGKSVYDHFAHLLVHGILHLRGFDHISDAQAAAMEARETELLARLDIGNPYLSDET